MIEDCNMGIGILENIAMIDEGSLLEDNIFHNISGENIKYLKLEDVEGLH